MATAAIFTLITNDGKQDRMLMATQLLHQRLCTIKNIRAKSSMDPTPTLHDIEKTHIIFTNAHFKPFAAIGFEYNKQRANAGTLTLGSRVTFSIQQFGDFFSDMALHVEMTGPLSTDVTSLATIVADVPLYRWCSWLGERLVKAASFDVNSNPLDDYTNTDSNFHREFFIPTWKMNAYSRCVGQELEQRGTLQQPDWVNNGIVSTTINHRRTGGILNGFQTPKGLPASTREAVELFVPLNFWFNSDVKLAVPSVAIPYGQRYLNIDLAEQAELVDLVPRGAGTYAAPGGTLSTSAVAITTLELYVNNIFVNPEIHDIYIKRVGFSLIRVHRRQKILANSSTAEVMLQQLKWPVEYLMVGMKVRCYHDVSGEYRRTHLDKWHTFSTVTNTNYTVQGVTGERLERLTTSAGAVVTVTSIAANGDIVFSGAASPAIAIGDVLDVRGLRYGMVTTSQVNVVSTAAATAAVVAGSPIYRITPAATTDRPTAGDQCVVPVPTPNLTTISIKAHGINIYDTYERQFFNSYIPYRYGGVNVRAPTDEGALLVPFCLYPGSYQPSGHINVSRAREFYIEYVSATAGATATTENTLCVSASCINFLLISDGSAVLRYST